MKQMVVILLLLFGGFLGLWVYKIETPIARPDEYQEGYKEGAGEWWNGKDEVDDSWKLDPELPVNYIPVPGEYELYMVVDNDGNVSGYRKRTKQIDGSWTWEDVNPDIPENYEKVEGLENVYKVTDENGNTKYFRYVRNADSTFAFVEVDENGKEIGKNRDATVIDGKHVHISGNVYSELNENGVVIGYDKRVENQDGSFSWIETDMPASLGTLPSIDDKFSELQGDATTTLPSSGTSLDSSFLDGMKQQMDAANQAANQGSQDIYNIQVNNFNTELPQQGSNFVDVTPSTPTIISNKDGTHTEVETIRETKKVDGYTSVYETTVYKKYDVDGNLLETKKDGPIEVSASKDIVKETEPVQANTENKQSSLGGEVARVSGSYSYKTDISGQLFAMVNAQRQSKSLSSLQNSDTANQIAKLRAADMAGYDVSKSELPTYGNLGHMITEYGVSSSQPGETLWKTTARSADEINSRFQAVDSARNTRMAQYATQYGCAVVEKNGYYYIAEIIL